MLVKEVAEVLPHFLAVDFAVHFVSALRVEMGFYCHAVSFVE